MITEQEVEDILMNKPYVDFTGNLYIIYCGSYVKSTDNISDLQELVKKLVEREIYLELKVKDFNGFHYDVFYDKNSFKCTINNKLRGCDFIKFKEVEDVLRVNLTNLDEFGESVKNVTNVDSKQISEIDRLYKSLKHGSELLFHKLQGSNFGKIKDTEDELRKNLINLDVFQDCVKNLIRLDSKQIYEIRELYQSVKYGSEMLFYKSASLVECNKTECQDLSFLIPENLKKHLMIAGGYIINNILGLPEDPTIDIDIFVISDSPVKTLRDYLNWMDKNFGIDWCRRTDKVITLKSTNGYLIQIMLRDYKSPEQVLFGFDVDSSSCGYYNGSYYVTDRCKYAMVNRVNNVDLGRISTSYEYRLAKYASRKGFYVNNPGFNRKMEGEIKNKLDVRTKSGKKKYQTINGLRKLIYIEKKLEADLGRDIDSIVTIESDYHHYLNVNKDKKELANGKFLFVKEHGVTSNDINCIMDAQYYENLSPSKIELLGKENIRVNFITHSPNSQGYFDKFTCSWKPIFMSWKIWNQTSNVKNPQPIDFS